MKKTLLKLIILPVIVIALVILSSPVFAIDCNTCSNQKNLSTQQSIECGTNCAGGSTQTPGQATTDINSTITTVINLLSVGVGIAAVIMIILAGYRYITSGGSSEKVSSAKNALLYAIIGLVIVALAQVTVKFVLHTTTAKKTSSSSSPNKQVAYSPY